MLSKIKFIKLFVLGSFLMFLFLMYTSPNVVVAANACDTLSGQIKALDTDNVNPLGTDIPKFCTVNSLSYKVIQILFYVSGGVAVVFLMIGGFQYIIGMSTGGDEAIGKAKKTITYALIGLVIVILSGTIVLMVYNLITNNNSGLTGSTSNNTNTDPNNGGGGIIQTGGGNSDTTPGDITYTIEFVSDRGNYGGYYDIKLNATAEKIKAFCGKVPAQVKVLVDGTVEGSPQSWNGGLITFSSVGSENGESAITVEVCDKEVGPN